MLRAGIDTASWTFTGLAPGIYEVSVTWVGIRNRATNAPYTIYDGASQRGRPILVNQELAADGGLHARAGNPSRSFRLGRHITSGTLVVELSNNANGTYVIADAVRIELVAACGTRSTAPTADLASPADGDSIDPLCSTRRLIWR